MSDPNTQTLLDALKILSEMQKPTSPLLYRLYHDDDGWPLFYTMEDLPGLYIDIDPKTFAESSSHVRVLDGKLIKFKSGGAYRLRPDEQGTPCDPRDVCVVVPDSVPHIRWRNRGED